MSRQLGLFDVRASMRSRKRGSRIRVGAGIGLGSGSGSGLELGLRHYIEPRTGDRTRLEGIATSRRYRQTKSAQALKETNTFKTANLWLGLDRFWSKDTGIQLGLGLGLGLRG